MSAPRFAVALVVGMLMATSVYAQEMEPRAYSNAPIGMNFFVAGYALSQGDVSVDPSLPVEDATLEIHSGVFAYARALDLCGKSGKLDIALPYSRLAGTAKVAGEPAARDVHGFGDVRLRLSANLYGAPALSLREFAGYRRNLVIGGSVQVAFPVGQYDSSKAVNLGTNRWSVRGDIGFSKSAGALTLEMTTSVGLYQDNDDYFGGKLLEQAPIYAAQANVTYDFGGDIWGGLGATYYRGGRTTTDGDVSDVELGNARVGAVLVFPMSRVHSVKLGHSRGVYTRTGTSFSVYGISWQYRWGAGL